jgi:endoglucanase
MRGLPGSWRGVRSRGCPVSAYVSGTPATQVQSPLLAVPQIQTSPTISGSAVVGRALTTSKGSWSNSPSSYSYAWEDCNSSGGKCSQISRAASNSYVLGSGDVGSTIRSVVTATNGVGSTAASSAHTAAVTQPAPVNTALPVITGTPQQGDTITVSNGSWSGETPITYTYAWSDGQTGQSITLGSGDVGQNITATVTATNDAGHASATSASVGPVTAAGPPPSNGIHVDGTQLLDGNGNPIQLHGVDRAGTEYACIQGWGIFDGPNVTNDDAEAPLYQAWHANSVFIGLNEDCWLGINGVPAAYSGQNYIKAIVHYAQTLEAHGIYPIIGLFWSAPGTQAATGQSSMPDNDHSPAFWQSVANTFKNDPNVIFRLKEEPFPGHNGDSTAIWKCWSAGDVQYDTSNTLTPVSQNSNCSESFKTVGMQSLINIIRGTGATNVIQVPGIQYANTMDHFLDAGIRVTDTLSPPQLMGDVDTYPNGNGCGSTACYDSQYAPVAAVMPFDFGEFGESVDGSDCTTTGVSAIMSWADAHHASYGAWDWDTWGGCLQLISSYSTGAPNGNWGNALQTHYLTFPANTVPLP